VKTLLVGNRAVLFEPFCQSTQFCSLLFYCIVFINKMFIYSLIHSHATTHTIDGTEALCFRVVRPFVRASMRAMEREIPDRLTVDL